MRFGLDISQHHLSWEEIVRRARLAEDAGFDGAWVFDHFKPLYADPTGPTMEGWTLLAGLAAATKRIRLGTLVTGVTYRHPSVLAAEAVTVDHISNGRVEMAIGAAWFQQEHDELGIEFPPTKERAARLEEAVEVINLLMTEDEVTFEGRYYQLRGATYNPKPVQQPRPPVWIGASGEKLMLPLAGRVADVWHGFGDLPALKRKLSILDEHASNAGRNPRDIRRSTWLSISEPLDEIRSTAEKLQAAGFDYLTVSWPGEGDSKVEAFVNEVLPTFSA